MLSGIGPRAELAAMVFQSSMSFPASAKTIKTIRSSR